MEYADPLLDEQLEKAGFDDFGASIRAGVRGLWSGQLSYMTFVDHMISTLDRGYTRAWAEGAKEFGVRPDEYTEEEVRARLDQLYNDVSYVYAFGNAIVAGSKANGGKLATLFTRAQMWQSRYIAVKEQAKAFAAKDRKLRWVHGPTKEPCKDCINYTNRVYRASVWRRYNIYPRTWNLECHGIHCRCSFQETDEPATPGRPPMPSG